MRRQLIAVLGSDEEADESLKLLLAHLVSAGFGDHKQGRLRDFLVRGMRSAAKSRLGETIRQDDGEADIESLTLESKSWLRYWREGLLERAWRSLERIEHANPESPVYSILHVATTNPGATPEMLAVQIKAELGLQTEADRIRETLPEARAMFAQLVADEVAETLEAPSAEDVKREIVQLGLGKAFSGVVV
jgi:hypothetical protein